LGLTKIFLPDTLIFTPSGSAGNTLRLLSAFCGFIHSPKVKTMVLFFGTFIVPAGGEAERTEGGVLSSSPPLGGIWWAQNISMQDMAINRRRIIREDFIFIQTNLLKQG
jgi:hypothetical protein